MNDLYATTTPTTVVLNVFGKIKPGAPGNIWTDSLKPESHKDAAEWQTDSYPSCYRAGNPCPEDHTVCSPTYCHMDRFRTIAAGFKAQSPEKINVLGVIDVGDPLTWEDDMTAIAEYRDRMTGDAEMHGFYLVLPDGQPSKASAPGRRHSSPCHRPSLHRPRDEA